MSSAESCILFCNCTGSMWSTHVGLYSIEIHANGWPSHYKVRDPMHIFNNTCWDSSYHLCQDSWKCARNSFKTWSSQYRRSYVFQQQRYCQQCQVGYKNHYIIAKSATQGKFPAWPPPEVHHDQDEEWMFRQYWRSSLRVFKYVHASQKTVIEYEVKWTKIAIWFS